MSGGPGSPSARPEPSYVPSVPPNPRLTSGTFMRIFGIVVGILIFAGFLSLQALFLVPPPCGTSGCGTVSPEQAAYDNTVHGLAWAGIVLLDLSVGLSVMFAFFLNSENSVPESTRRSAFFFASVYLASYTLLSWILLSILFGTVRML